MAIFNCYVSSPEGSPFSDSFNTDFFNTDIQLGINWEYDDTPWYTTKFGGIGGILFSDEAQERVVGGRCHDASVPEKYDQSAYLEHNCTGNFMIECPQWLMNFLSHRFVWQFQVL